ncbi:MAG: septum formation initiator family protein [Parvularculaceae bacterium]|nr:septum formation initiator family protein [Parvularculaceae bacterium]
MYAVWSAFRSSIAPLLIAAYIAYLGYGAIAGAAGLTVLGRLQKEERELAAEVAAIKAKREALQQRADLLHPNSLDPEMMEERIRAVLGYVREGDVVIPRAEIEKALEAEPAVRR